jgi:hypothetical protein
LWNFIQKIWRPQNNKKKIENFITSKYQIKNRQNSQEERQIPLLPPCEILHTKNLKTHKMSRRKIEDSQTSKC